MLAEHSPANALTDRPNSANGFHRSKLTQYSCHFLCQYSLSALSLKAGLFCFFLASLFFHLSNPVGTVVPAELLFCVLRVGELSDEDPSVVPGGAAGVRLQPREQ